MTHPPRTSLLRRLLPLAPFFLLACGGGGGGGESTPPPPPPPDYSPTNPRLTKTSLLGDLQTLSAPAMGGRKMGSAGNADARALIVQRFQTLGLGSYGGSFTQTFSSPYDGTGTNVIGYLAGSNPSLSGRVILVTAHYDHIGTRNGQVVCGADDNASGTAGVLQLAAWLKDHPPARTVVFCLFDGEEAGLLGSEAFAALPQGTSRPFPLSAIDVVLNLDMVAQGTKGQIFVGGTTASPELKPFLTQAFATSRITVVPDYERYDQQSDQGPFMNRGVPFLFFCVGDDDPYYHTARDTFANIPQSFYWGCTEAILETFLRLDARPALATLLPRPPERHLKPFERTWKAHPWSHRPQEPVEP